MLWWTLARPGLVIRPVSLVVCPGLCLHPSSAPCLSTLDLLCSGMPTDVRGPATNTVTYMFNLYLNSLSARLPLVLQVGSPKCLRMYGKYWDPMFDQLMQWQNCIAARPDSEFFRNIAKLC